MTRKRKIILSLAGLALAGVTATLWFVENYENRDPSRLQFAEHCTSCHGENLDGSESGPSLLSSALQGGSSTQNLSDSIRNHSQMDAIHWLEEQPDWTTKALAIYISEQRQQFGTTTDSYQRRISGEVIQSQYYDLRVEHITEFSTPPYAMAPLPDGTLLVSEKVRGLSRIDSNGNSTLIQGTPAAWEELIQVRNSYIGLGMYLDVELHPDYEDNGWIYLSHSERCQLNCNSLVPQTMVRVVRGRLDYGQWVDEELIWSVHHDHYTVVPDAVACGRMAFDQEGHIFVSVGGKSTYNNLHNLDTPYGKIHRVSDNGEIPRDNPFWVEEAARGSSTRHTVWTYGHRTSQGLAAHPASGEIWNSEMGPKGGDEVNHLKAGGNYGWPLYTNGLDYDGTPITTGEDLGLDFPETETIRPIVDFTPAPALSNMVFHEGERFPEWQNDLLLGSLRARTLYRLRIEGEQLIEEEKLLTDVGRIRDVEMGFDDLVYVLIEHEQGGSLLRLVPEAR